MRGIMQSGRGGFTLLELNIAIAIIGLLAGAILAGQGLMKRSELRRVLVDANGYSIAVQQFQQKYNALPGDMATATSIWGRADGGSPVTANCANPLANVSNGKPTCNGDGNGVIDATNCEHYRVWQQLAAGAFISGNFTGVSGIAACAPNSVRNVNVPAGAVDGSAYSIGSLGVFMGGGSAAYYDGDYTNVLMFGGVRNSDYSNAAALKPEEAFELDKKADDGNPARGSIRTVRPAYAVTPNCTTGGEDYNGTYTQPACALLFLRSYLNTTNH